MNCKKTQENLYDYLDGALSPSESAALRAHLGECATCREIVQRETDFARSLSSRLDRAVEGVRLDPHAQRRIVGMMENKVVHSRPDSVPSFWMQLALRFAAAAAVLVLIIGAIHQFGSRRSSQPEQARVSMPLTAPEVSVNLIYCVPSYTFHREGNMVIDALVCEPRVTEASFIVKN